LEAEDAARREHEIGLGLFVVPERRVRFRDSLENPRRRKKLHHELYHFERRLDSRFARRHAPHTKYDGHVEQVLELLRKKGAPPSCFVMADIDLDGQEAELGQAVEALMLSGAGFISCVPGCLGLYVSEDGSNVFVLERDA